MLSSSSLSCPLRAGISPSKDTTLKSYDPKRAAKVLTLLSIDSTRGSKAVTCTESVLKSSSSTPTWRTKTCSSASILATLLPSEIEEGSPTTGKSSTLSRVPTLSPNVSSCTRSVFSFPSSDPAWMLNVLKSAPKSATRASIAACCNFTALTPLRLARTWPRTIFISTPSVPTRVSTEATCALQNRIRFSSEATLPSNALASVRTIPT
mmetsp:Transcript_35169/g.88634  ORF Transcript_35169/g.88634 Transcript_35169/m.88634 type:complete len:208 (-) Transcript_35169:585-1208(-)